MAGQALVAVVAVFMVLVDVVVGITQYTDHSTVHRALHLAPHSNSTMLDIVGILLVHGTWQIYTVSYETQNI